MATEAVEEIPEPIPKRSDIAKGIRTIYLNRVAHMGMMLEKMNRQNRRVERLEKFAATADVKDLDAPEDEEDMGVNIGNEFHYHGITPQAALPNQPETAVSKPTTDASSTASKLAPAVVALSMLGGGAGVGYIINDLWKQPAPVQSSPDTDTVTEIYFPGAKAAQ